MVAGRSIIAVVAMGTLIFGFQNCSKVAPSEVEFSQASLQTAAIPTGAGDDSAIVDDSTPSPSPSPSSSPSNGHASNGGKDQGHSCNGKDDSSIDQSADQLVECELNSSSDKVVLAESIAIGSNAQLNRICMSENACLNLVNEYAVSHDCSLTPGAATSPSSNGVQCTKVFPGSKGTCKNAKVLSDADVSALLAKLGK